MEDNDNKLQEARKRQVAELQKEMQLREALRQILEPDAFERLMNVRMANRELYFQIAQMLLYAAQQGKLQGKIGEQELLAILNKIKSGEKEPTITFKRK